MWSITVCPKCGKSGGCCCCRLGTCVFDYVYEYIFVCRHCDNIQTIKEEGGCWSNLAPKCPFCLKDYKAHRKPPKEIENFK